MQDEETLWEGKPQLKGSLGGFIFIGLLTVIIALFALVSKSIGGLLITVVLGGGLFVIMLYSLKQTTYTITNKRVIRHRSIFGEKQSEVRLDKIQNLGLKRGIVQRRLGEYGSISLSTAGSGSTDMSLQGIDDIHTLYHLLLDETRTKTVQEKPDAEAEDTTEQLNAMEEAKKLRKTMKKFEKVITQ